jgi:hypothetical protein
MFRNPSRVATVFEAIAEIAVATGPILLTGMGIAVALIPNLARRRERLWWVAAFLIVGTPVAAFTWYEMHSASQFQKQVLGELTGGDNYCYVVTFPVERNGNVLRIGLKKNAPGPLFEVAGMIWKADAAPGARPEAINQFNIPTMNEMVQGFDDFLTEGEYTVRIITRNMQIIQTINIKRVNGVLVSEMDGFHMPSGKYGAVPISFQFSDPPRNYSSRRDGWSLLPWKWFQ